MTDKSRQYWEDKAQTLKIEGRAFINGEYVDALLGQTRPTYNPATGKFIVDIASCSIEDADFAVKIARNTFNSGVWSKMAPEKRKSILLRWADLIEENWEELALLESIDTGKPISCTMNDDGGDVHSSIRTLRWTAESIDKSYDELTPAKTKTLGLVTRVPVGVVAAITPWNYPLSTTMWKLAPSLGAGNSVILKPASNTPLTAIRIVKLAAEAGLPDGVLSVLPGSGAVLGEHFGLHDDIDCIGFTGSTPIGKQLLIYSGQSNHKLIFNELGGKSANIVFPDADLEKAAAKSAAAIFFNTGQTCTAGSRLVIHEDIHDQFVDMLIEQAGKYWQPGYPLDPATLMGPMIDEGQCKTVQEYIEIGKSEGATVVLGGNKVPIVDGGHYIEPTILTDVTNDMRVAQEEIFGPVLVVIKFKTTDEAITIANDSIYGLAGAVWTADLKRAHYVASEVRTGNMNVNTYFGCDNQITMPFGGFKQTGNGRDKSMHAFHDYTILKSTWFDLS